MADTSPRRPHPGQQYTHGWNPVTPAAAVAKNHGRKVKAGSAISRLLKEASESHKRMQQQDADRKAGKTPDMTVPKGAPTKSAAAKAGEKRGPESQKAEDALRAALGRKVAAPKMEKSAEAPKSAKAGKVSDAEVESKISDAYWSLAKEPQDWVKLSALRKKLGDAPREQVDKVLRSMMRGDDVHILRDDDQRSLTDADREGALDFGAGPKHIIAMEESKRPSAKAEAPKTAKAEKTAKALDYAKKLKPSGKKVGEDSRGNPLKTGDDVKITAGPNAGKTGKVAGKGKNGAVLVDTGEGDPVSMSPANLSGAGGKKETPKAEAKPAATQASSLAPEKPKSAAAPVTLAPKPAATQTPPRERESSGEKYFSDNPYPNGQGAPEGVDRREGGKRVSEAEMEAAIRDVYEKTAPNPGDWINMSQLREGLQKKGLTRAQTDEVLKKMYLERDDIHMLGAGIVGHLTPQHNSDAARIGPEWQHQFKVIPRLGDRKDSGSPPNPSSAQNGSGKASTSGSAKGPYGFDSSAPKSQQVEQAQRIIREVYDDLADEHASGWLSMAKLRKELDGIPRDVQDDALTKLISQPDMRLVPESVRRGMSQEERDAAFHILGDPDDPIDLIMVTNPDGSRRESAPNRERLKANRERAAKEGPKATNATPKPAKTYDFDSSAPRSQQVARAAEVIREAYDDLDDRKGRTGWLPLIELRKSLKGIPRDVQDDALKKLMAASDFNTSNTPARGLDSGPAPKAEDLDKAALDVFGEPVHGIMIADYTGRARRKAK